MSFHCENSYRPEIDGLRAIAVTVVVLFHAFPTLLPGGFVGVDVFFVISGFLISRLIFGDLETGEFSFSAFYARRARRILPMLMVTVLTSVAAGYVLLYPGDYRSLGFSAIAALLGWSNFFFLNNTGYFDIPSQTMPLLHTWSLGVEEQFYLVWPALLFAGTKLLGRSRNIWIAIFLIVILVSFRDALATVATDRKAAFYWPHTRAWELALGALLVVIPGAHAKTRLATAMTEALPILGLAAIIYASARFSPDVPFPRYNALVPTLGAALLIYPRATIVQRALSTAPFRFVGLISFSLYLWHWPVLVFFKIYANGYPLTWQTSLVLVATAVVLSTLSWRLIEQPLRRHRATSHSTLGAAAILNAAAVLVAVWIVQADGFPRRLPPDLVALDGLDRMWAWPCPQEVALGLLPNSEMAPKTSCAFGTDWNGAQHHALLWGNSFAEHLAPLFDLAGKATGTSIALAYSCPILTERDAPVAVTSDLSPQRIPWCDAARDKVLRLITKPNEIDTVILSTTWSSNWLLLDATSELKGRSILVEGLDRLLTEINAAGKKVIIFADGPESASSDSANCVLTALAWMPRIPCKTNSSYIDLQTLKYKLDTHAALKQVVTRHARVFMIEPMDFLCDTTRCSRYVNGEFIYRDAGHFRRNLTSQTVSALVDGFRLEDVLRD